MYGVLAPCPVVLELGPDQDPVLILHRQMMEKTVKGRFLKHRRVTCMNVQVCCV